MKRRKILNLVWDKKCNTKNKPNVSIAKKSGSALFVLWVRERGGPFVDWPQTHACCNFSAFFPAEKKPKRNKRQQHQRRVAAIPPFRQSCLSSRSFSSSQSNMKEENGKHEKKLFCLLSCPNSVALTWYVESTFSYFLPCHHCLH